MAGPVAFGAVAVESLLSPCLSCVDALNFSRRRPPASSSTSSSSSSIELGSSFLDTWHRRRAPRPLAAVAKKKQQSCSRRRGGLLLVVDELGGQYEEGFDDVHVVIEIVDPSPFFYSRKLVVY